MIDEISYNETLTETVGTPDVDSYSPDSIGPEIEAETQKETKARGKLEKQYTMKELHLNKEQELFLQEKLSSKFWRMNNLYTIRDKNNVKQIMKLNASQVTVIHQFMHTRKIILKSRQQGISTLYLAYYLDDCLFKPGFQAGIQSYGMDEAAKLQKRAELMWEEIDPNIKEMLGLKLISNNSKGMTFSNGSILKIGNFRGDTLQGLHISELGKIAKRYPEKAKELKTGAFQAVGISNKITIESTAEGKQGLFYEMWMKAIQKKDLGRKLTPLDFEPIFLSWLDDPDCRMVEDYPLEPRHIEYIDRIEVELNISLEIEQKNWLAGKLDELEDDFDQEYPATPERAFAQSIDGTYLHHQYRRLLESKRINWYPHMKGIEVHVSFDLGLNDEMVLTFAQIVDGIPRIINEYHNTGEGLAFYVTVMGGLRDTLGYKYGRIILPHDANVKELGTGFTRVETLRRLGVTNIDLLTRLPFMESIQAVRAFIDVLEVHEKCDNMVLAIQNYRKKYDKQLGVYLNIDVHDIHSNYIASLRYMAQGLGFYRIKKVRSEKTQTSLNFNQIIPQNSDFAI